MKKKIRWDKKKLLTALIVFVAWLLITVFVPGLPDMGLTTGAPQTEATTEGVTDEPTKPPAQEPTEEVLDRDGTYTSKEDVALYLYLYGELPKNFFTKGEVVFSNDGLIYYTDDHYETFELLYTKDGPQ